MTATCTYGHTERTAWCKSCRTTFPGCKIDGCTEPHYGRGFCHLHAEQDRRLNGSPNGGGRWARGSRPTTCQDDTCSNPHYARGLCTLHYKREERARKAAERALQPPSPRKPPAPPKLPAGWHTRAPKPAATRRRDLVAYSEETILMPHPLADNILDAARNTLHRHHADDLADMLGLTKVA